LRQLSFGALRALCIGDDKREVELALDSRLLRAEEVAMSLAIELSPGTKWTINLAESSNGPPFPEIVPKPTFLLSALNSFQAILTSLKSDI
jgi:hypothetical protein